MNSNLWLSGIWRYLICAAIQVLFFRQVDLSIGSYFNVMIYPLAIFLLPLQLRAPYMVLLGFLIGITIDIPYNSPGVHASAGAFSGFARSILLTPYEPKNGFTGKEPIFSPAYFGWQRFLQTVAMFYALHLFWYFSVDAFTFVYFDKIALKALASLVLSMVCVGFYVFLTNPKS
jgi:hypothetical protein